MYRNIGTLLLAFGIAGCSVGAPTYLNGGSHGVKGEDSTVLSVYPAFGGITPTEREKIQAFIDRCPEEYGAKVYFDPLYRGFYHEPSSQITQLPEICRVYERVPPFIPPMATPPFMPARVMNVYESLPPTIEVSVSQQDVERAAERINDHSGCAANSIESARALEDSIWVQVNVVSMDQYLDADPMFFLNEKDQQVIREVLDQGIPVTISPVYSCVVTLHEWNWDGSKKK